VVWWQSEEVVVPYYSPIDGKRHRYFPDVIVHTKPPGGEPKTIMIEIKPDGQTRPPDRSKMKTAKGRVSRRYLNEVKTYGVNEAKWKAAKMFCAQRGWEFQIYTEKTLGIK